MTEIVAVPPTDVPPSEPLFGAASVKIVAQDRITVRAVGPGVRLAPTSGSLLFAVPKPVVLATVNTVSKASLPVQRCCSVALACLAVIQP